MMRNLIASVAVCSLGLACVAQDDPQNPHRQPKPRENNLLLREYKPVSNLHVPVHEVKRAKFPVVDIHNHVNDGWSGPGTSGHKDPKELVRLMDDLNIKTIVILTGAWGDKLQRVIDEMVKPNPGRFVVMTQIDWSKLGDPNFSGLMVSQIRDAVGRGARGLKVLKDLGLGVRDPKTNKLITVDDPRLDPIWEECARQHIPVAIHVADPEAFFRPIDNTNERYAELSEHPDWSFCCPPKFPTIQEIMNARDRMIAKHPNTQFILLHVGNWPENLDYVEKTLKRFPNVTVELGARQAELGRQPRRARQLFMNYPDRVLFGTDMEPTAPLYRSYFRWLETADESFEYFGWPVQGFWSIYGLGLPDDVLKRVYATNAERILGEYGSAHRGSGR